MISSVAGPRRSSKRKHPKKWSRLLFGGLLPIWSTTIFWIPEKTLHLSSTLSKWMRCTEKLQCLQLALIDRKGPIPLHDNAQLHITQPMLQKLNKLGYEVLKFGKSYSSATFTWLLANLTTTSSSISITFCRQTVPATSKRQKTLSKSSSDPEAWIFCYGNKLISHWQKCVDCNDSYFD